MSLRYTVTIWKDYHGKWVVERTPVGHTPVGWS